MCKIKEKENYMKILLSLLLVVFLTTGCTWFGVEDDEENGDNNEANGETQEE